MSGAGASPDDPLDARALRRALADAGSALRLDLRDEAPSTNDIAADALRAPDGPLAPVAVLAELQTAGRGRQGAPWMGRRGASLALSVGWPSTRSLAESAGLPLAIGVACAEALAGCGVRGVRLKWPNDLLAGEAKLGGILVETRASGSRCLVVAGVGVNVRRAAVAGAPLDRPVSAIEDLVEPVPSRTMLAAALLVDIERALARFDAEGFAAFRDRWLALHAWTGRTVVATRGAGVVVTGVATGVDADGALLVRTPAGIERIIAADISLRAS